MPYVITEACKDTKDRACVDVCPVDCIYEGPEQLYIHPDECIDCGACEPECPVTAIFPEEDVPANLKDVADKWEQFNEKDRELKKALAGAKAALEREKRNATLSVGQQEDVAKLSGEVVSKTVDVDLTISGQVQPYVMTLRKYELSGGTGPRTVSRWVIQNITPKG